MPLHASDRQRLRQALALAEHAIGLSEPNPRVGCVLADASGQVVGTGFTQQAGGPHAEVMALRDAEASGASLRGGTAWVTLEPCAHHGRTPPCCDALVRAGLARVVVAAGDPFPAVAGAGLARLRAAGIEVEMADGDEARAARELNIGFFSRIERGRPWVRAKVAASLDGFTALPDGRSQWITGEAARHDGHGWRRRAGAILTGIGTVLADDPRLDVRGWATTVQPLRVVVDSAGRTPAGARIRQAPGELLLVVAQEGIDGHGAPVLCLPGPDGRVDLPGLMARLAGRGVNELHVEAGPALTGSLIDAGLVDELLLYLAPRLLGGGRPLVRLALQADLDEAAGWRHCEQTPVGLDLRLRLRQAVSAGFTDPAHPK